jgi:hypothetical protein
MRSGALFALAAGLLAAAPADAEPLRLRGDALARAESPVGLLTLSADGDVMPNLSAEAVVWAAASDDDDSTGDALVIVVRYRDPKHRGEARVGRFVAALGGLMPVHVDGGWGLVRLPHELRAEAFAGIPVQPELGAAAGDWIAGTRLSRALGDWGGVGISYQQRREENELADEEIAIDGGYAPEPWLDLAGRASLDLIQTGLSEVHLSAALRRKAWRVELFGLHRSPSRLLPATSLFSVIGDVPSQRAGASARWRAAPRLDVDATAAVRRLDDDFGESLSCRGLLRLDDRGEGAVSLELRREGAPDGAFTGVRAAGRMPLPRDLSLALEAELARADDPEDRGDLWPWGLVAVRWMVRPTWTVAAAVEGSATPEYSSRVDAMLRVAYAWEVSR